MQDRAPDTYVDTLRDPWGACCIACRGEVEEDRREWGYPICQRCLPSRGTHPILVAPDCPDATD